LKQFIPASIADNNLHPFLSILLFPSSFSQSSPVKLKL
jgi:hypothetical protein